MWILDNKNLQFLRGVPMRDKKGEHINFKTFYIFKLNKRKVDLL